MAAAGLLQVDGDQAIFPLTYHDLFRRLIAPGLDADAAKADYYDKWGARAYAFGPLVDPGLTGLTGARWLYVVGEQVPSVPGIVARWHQGRTTVYEDPGVLPRAFVAGALEVEQTSASVLDAVARASREELRARAFGSPAPEIDRLRASLGADGGEPGPAGSASIVSSAPDLVELDVRANRPGVLVLTDVMAPGWTAERDGVATPIATVDGAFRGVAVDADTRRVVFRYAPGFTYAGVAVALLASLLVLVAIGLGVRSDRRSRPRDDGTPSATLVSATDDRRPGEEEP
jgi:hypothetical protein